MNEVTETIVDRATAGQGKCFPTIVAYAATGNMFKLSTWLLRDHINSAAGCIAAKQRSLGTTKYFDTLGQVYRG